MPRHDVLPRQSMTRRELIGAAGVLAAFASVPAIARAAEVTPVTPDDGTDERLADAQSRLDAMDARLSTATKAAEMSAYRQAKAKDALSQAMGDMEDAQDAASDARSKLAEASDELKAAAEDDPDVARRIASVGSAAELADVLSGTSAADAAKAASDAADELSRAQGRIESSRGGVESMRAKLASDEKALSESVSALESQTAELRSLVASLSAQAQSEEQAYQSHLAALSAQARQTATIDGESVPVTQIITTITRGSDADSIGEAAAELAISQLGVPYVWGGSDPSGFDCSGLVTWSYAQLGYSLPRTTYDLITYLQERGTWVTDPSLLHVGDLVFPSEGHVMMWLGDGQLVHAPQPGDVVSITGLYAFIGGGTPV